MWVGWIEAEGVALGGGCELGAGDAEGGVGAGIAEVPGELDAGGFDLEGGEGGSGVAGGGPETLGFDGEGGEEDGEGGEGKVFDAPEVFLRRVAAGEEADEEDEVGEGEEGEGDPEVEEELAVERGAVGAGVGGQPEGRLEACGIVTGGSRVLQEGVQAEDRQGRVLVVYCETGDLTGRGRGSPSSITEA